MCGDKTQTLSEEGVITEDDDFKEVSNEIKVALSAYSQNRRNSVLATKAIHSMQGFARVYGESSVSDLDASQTFDEPTRTSKARNALWDAFALPETTTALQLHDGERQVDRRTAVQRLQHARFDYYCGLELSVNAINHFIHHGGSVVESETAPRVEMLYSDVDKVIVEIRSIISRLILQEITAVPLHPRIDFAAVKDEFERNYAEFGYKYFSDQKGANGKSKLIGWMESASGRWGLKFGDLRMKNIRKSQEKKIKRSPRRR